ncbi:hypothetical protein OIU77_022016 [Salix suchowensis]|uniref:Uncharacterized protein n=1 Tax=Salix suchowensis TaxID=1278906 RepID=A0ABQ9CF49_9ROSI|nr:hypothetical protein OIU77_022016 [Salix suchowensis]
MKFFPCCIPEREDALVESTSCTDKESAKHGRALSSWKNMSWKIGSSKRKNSLKVFTYHELSVATDDFNPSFSVGEGGFGKFKNWLDLGLGPLFKDKSKFTAMADPLLEGNYSQKSLYQALAIAAMCLQVEADTRPLMADVVTALEFLTGPIEEKKPTVSPPQSIHHVNSVTEGNVKQELEP